MGTISKVNDVLCANISKIDDVLKANASKFDDNIFCPASPTPTPTPTQSPGASPTPTPTITPTPTPTPSTPCRRGCCYVELCIGGDCTDACQCNNVRGVYLSIPCDGDPCLLSTASGIYDDDTCSTQAATAYYSDGVDCYYWDGTNLSYQGPC